MFFFQCSLCDRNVCLFYINNTMLFRELKTTGGVVSEGCKGELDGMNPLSSLPGLRRIHVRSRVEEDVVC